MKVWTSESWSQEQDSHQCCSSWHFLRPQAQRPVPTPTPVCVTLGKSSNISVPQVSSCKWSCPRSCKNGAIGCSRTGSEKQLSRSRCVRKKKNESVKCTKATTILLQTNYQMWWQEEHWPTLNLSMASSWVWFHKGFTSLGHRQCKRRLSLMAKCTDLHIFFCWVTALSRKFRRAGDMSVHPLNYPFSCSWHLLFCCFIERQNTELFAMISQPQHCLHGRQGWI